MITGNIINIDDKAIGVGDRVYNKHRVGFTHAYSSCSKPVYGVVKSIEPGCNTIYWVDFNRGYLTPMISIDIGMGMHSNNGQDIK